MVSHKLVPYKIRIKNTEIEKYYHLQNIGLSGYSLSELIESYCQKYLQKFFDDDKKEKTVRFDNLSTSNNSINAKILSGEYGIRAEIREKNNPQNVKTTRQEDDVEEIQLFFKYKEVDEYEWTAFTSMHRFKNYGAKTTFQEGLEEHIQKKVDNDEIEVEMNPVISSDIIHKLQNSDRNFQIKLLKHQTSNSAGSQLYNDEEVIVEKIIRPFKQGASLSLIEDKIKSLMNQDNAQGIEISDETFDEVKFTVKDEGSQETLGIDRYGNSSFKMFKKLVEGDEIELGVIRPPIDILSNESDSIITRAKEAISGDPKSEKRIDPDW